MRFESFSISEVIPARPEQIYAAWLSSEEHTAFTGDTASVDAAIGGEHSAFSGYARGITVELQPGRRIVQTWRTTQFPTGSPDSRLEVTLEETVGGTMLTIFHTDIPSGQSDAYRESWEKYYLQSLKEYFKVPPETYRPGAPVKRQTNARAATKTKASPARPMNGVNKVAAPRAGAMAKPAAQRLDANRTSATGGRAKARSAKRGKPKASSTKRTARRGASRTGKKAGSVRRKASLPNRRSRAKATPKKITPRARISKTPAKSAKRPPRAKPSKRKPS